MKRQNNRRLEPKRRIAVMGSTGSIGTQTLDIVREFPDRFAVTALTAGRNWELLARQALEFRPEMAVIADEENFPALAQALEGTGIKVAAGKEALIEAAVMPESDIVVGALVGYSGLPSTIAALEAGKTVALANKETLVVGGEIISRLTAGRKKKNLLPVDSEHSAIFQCLWGEDPEAVTRIILTASGGPFRNCSKEQLQRVTVSQALSHPNWKMGAKVTVDSATMMNKGFEMIEARWLFDKSPREIEVVVHPESIIHSMVEFTDGSVKAQMSWPDMHLPISVALGYPERLPIQTRRLDFTAIGSLTFEQPDLLRFPLLGLAYAAAEAGGLVPTIMNAANEVAVKAFLDGKISFNDISRVVTASVNAAKGSVKGIDVSLETIGEAHREGMEIALGFINKKM